MTDQPYNQPGGPEQRSDLPAGAERGDTVEVERKDLNSALQDSFRSTLWDLKTHEPVKSLRDTGDQTEAVGRARAADGARGAYGVSTAGGAQSGPPAGTHAPHHPWLLGSFGGKKKPQVIRSKTSLEVEQSTYAAAYGASPQSSTVTYSASAEIGTGLAADRVQAEVERIRADVDRAKEESNQDPDQARTVVTANLEQREPKYTETVTMPVSKPAVQISPPQMPAEQVQPSHVPPDLPPPPVAPPSIPVVQGVPSGLPFQQSAPPSLPGNPPGPPGPPSPPVLPVQQMPPQMLSPEAPPLPPPLYPEASIPPGIVDSRPLILGTDLSSGTLQVPSKDRVPPSLRDDSEERPHPPLPTVADDDDGVRTIRKPRLSSYIDRQISAREEQSAEEGETVGPSFKPRGGPSKQIAIAVAAVAAIGLVATVVAQGISSGGKNWIPFSQSAGGSSVEKLADDAIAYGAYDDAVRILDKAIESNNNQASLYEKRGLSRLLSRKRDTYDNAVEDFTHAIKLDANLHQAYLDRAAARTELAQFEAALKDYDHLIAAHQDTAKVYFGRGLANFHWGDLKAAEEDFKKALEKKADYPEAMIALGNTFFKRGQPGDRELAKKQYDQAKDPQAVGLRNLAILLALDKRFDEAKGVYDKAIDINPGDANLYNERGLVKLQIKDANEFGAAIDFETAKRRDPQLDSAKKNLDALCKTLIDRGLNEIKTRKTNYHGYLLVGFALQELGRYKDAIYYLNAAINRKPDYAYSFELLGTCYKELGLYEDAIEPLTVGIERNPKSATAYADRCWALFKSNKEDQALSDAEKAITLDDKVSTPYTVRSALASARGDYEDALADAARLIKLEPKSATHHSNRALIYMRLKKYDEAERDFRQSIAMDPGHWHGYRELGSMMQDLGRNDEALLFMTKAVELEPGQETYPTRISFYQLSREYGKAIEDCNELITKNEVNPNNFVTRGFAETLAGKYEEAQKDYDRAVAMKEDDTTYASRGEYYVRCGMYQKADADFERALKIDPKSEIGLINSGVSFMLQKQWDKAVSVSNRLIEIDGWDEAGSFNATLRRWICENYMDRAGVGEVALKTANKNAGSFPWPTPIIRFLLGEIDAQQLKKEARTVWDVTDAHFYIGMKAMFEKHDQVARNELNWVIQEGTVPADEYLLAQQALKILDGKEAKQNR